MYLSMNEHDEAYITTECSPYSGQGVERVTEQVDYSGNTTFESPDDYFLRQGHNDSVRTLEAVKKWEKKKVQQNVAQLKSQKELIMHDKIAYEQAFKRAEPKDNSAPCQQWWVNRKWLFVRQVFLMGSRLQALMANGQR